ncbi:MAG: class D sortase [Ruminococcus sp.]|nr:class D sortase [Ruminococcus sp.]
MSKKRSYSTAAHIAAPFIVLAICTGIISAALIKPADKLKVYANLAFMDSLKSDPSDNSGLVVRENEIISTYDGKTSKTGEVIRPKFGELYAEIKSSRLDLDVPVYWGSNAELLEHGACNSSSSAVVGTEGNTVISAHADTFFAELEKLKEGDVLTIRTNYGKFTYKVKELITFNSSDRKYIAPTEDTRLTLYTCKKDLLGSSAIRIGVICDLTKSEFYTDIEEETE